MRKLIVLILLLNIFPLLAATNFTIDVEETEARVNPEDAKIFEGWIHNIGATATIFHMVRSTNEIPDDWTTSICYATTCYPPFVDESQSANEPLVNPGDSVFFDINFSTSTTAGSGQAWIVFTDLITEEKDSVLFKVSTETQAGLVITIHDTLLVTAPEEMVVFEGYVHNESSDSTVVQMTRVSNDIPDNWSSSICFATTCYPPHVNEASEGVEAGDSLFYDVSISTDAIDDQGSVLIRFTDLLSGEEIEQTFTVITETPEPVISAAIGDTSAEVVSGESYEFSGFIHNDSEEILTVFMVRDENNIPQDWTTMACFAGCQQANVDTLNSLINPDDSLEYNVTFNSAGEAADGSALFMFFADGKPDTIWQYFSLHTIATALEDQDINTVNSFELMGNYPNPFNPSTTIRYQIPANGQVQITLYDLSGKLVAQLLNAHQPAGAHSVKFDAMDLSSGTYIYQIKFAQQVKQGKMLLIR